MRVPGITPTRAAVCRHFDGVAGATCRAGVRYHGLTAPIFQVCLGRSECPAKFCEKYAVRTKEDLTREQMMERKLLRASDRAVKAAEAIRSCGRTAGEIECPNCGLILTFAVAPNGHKRARCETKNCVNFIE